MPPSRIWHAFFLSCRDVLYWLPFFQCFSNRSAATVDPSHLHVGIIYVTCNSPAELFHACRHVYTLHLFRVCVTSWGKRVVRLSNTSSSLLPSSYRLDLLDFLTLFFLQTPTCVSKYPASCNQIFENTYIRINIPSPVFRGGLTRNVLSLISTFLIETSIVFPPPALIGPFIRLESLILYNWPTLRTP